MKDFGKKVIDALTSQQLAELLDKILRGLNPAEFKKTLENGDPDIYQNICKLLDQKTTHSKVKTDQIWDDLWSDWADVVYEVGDQSGQYAVHENHWEPLYFDYESFLEDLNQVAKKMLPLLEDYCSKDDVRLFIDKFAEIEQSIDLYPEWMGAHENISALTGDVSKCFLEWSWLCSEDITHVLDHVKQVKELLRYAHLDKAVVTAFFEEFEDSIQKQIHLHLASSPDNWILSETLHYALSRVSPEAYLKACSSRLWSHWKEGLPLLKNAREQGKPEEVIHWIQAMISSSLRRSKDDLWQPEKGLLWEMTSFCAFEEKLLALLSEWERLAKQLGQAKTGIALQLQLLIYNNPTQFEKIYKFFNQYRPELDNEVWEDLTTSWKRLVHKQVSPYYAEKDPHWVDWLIDDCLCSEQGSFNTQVLQWLVQLQKEEQPILMRDNRFSTLTLGLGQFSNMKIEYPHLFQSLTEELSNSKDNITALADLLAKQEWRPLLDQVKEIWKRKYIHSVPNPYSVQKSDYTSHAEAMCLLKELNPDEYKKLYQQWSVEHKRRTNLWKAMRAAKLT